MMICRVSADGVSFRQPSHSLTVVVFGQPLTAKSAAKLGAIHIACLFIDAVPFAQDFNGSHEDGGALARSAPLVAVEP